jgi:hypothetical protein
MTAYNVTSTVLLSVSILKSQNKTEVSTVLQMRSVSSGDSGHHLPTENSLLLLAFFTRFTRTVATSRAC